MVAVHEIPYAADAPGVCATDLRRVLGRRRREVRMVAWGMRGSHQAFELPNADAADLLVLARREARSTEGGDSGIGFAGSVADAVLPGDRTPSGRREVGYVSVPTSDVLARLQPFIDAGLTVSSIVTPAVAHARLAARRWGHAGAPTTAVIAINGRATAVTIVRHGVTLLARELPWGFETDRTPGPALDLPACAARLASELRRSIVFLSQRTPVDVSHVLLCGDMPELRNLTAPLQQETGFAVEVLDTTDDADAATFGGSPSEQRQRSAAMRVAWTLAAESSTLPSLQPRETGDSGPGASFDAQAVRRLAAGLLVGMVVVGIAWGCLAWLAAGSRARLDALTRQNAALEADLVRLETAQQSAALARARAAALDAFDSQGPRLARVLEAIAAATPGDMVLTTMAAESAAGAWTLTIEGEARAGTPAAAQALFSAFLRTTSASPLIGPPVQTPVMKVEAGDVAPAEPRLLPAGCVLTFSAAFEVRK